MSVWPWPWWFQQWNTRLPTRRPPAQLTGLGIEPGFQERERDQRLDCRSGRIEPAQHLVAQGHVIVFRQHFPFDAANAVGKAVGIVARHRHHREHVAGGAVHHHDRAGFEADAPRGIVLQAAQDGELDRLAGHVFARAQIAHHAAEAVASTRRAPGTPRRRVSKCFSRPSLPILKPGVISSGLRSRS
jgi:hypothetical protein